MVDTNIQLHEICEVILRILNQKCGISVQGQEIEAHFFERAWDMPLQTLIYLMYFLEQEYPVIFQPKDIDDERFYSVNGLAHIIAEKIRDSTLNVLNAVNS